MGENSPIKAAKDADATDKVGRIIQAIMNPEVFPWNVSNAWQQMEYLLVVWLLYKCQYLFTVTRTDWRICSCLLLFSFRGRFGVWFSTLVSKVDQPESGSVPAGTVMNGVIKQDCLDHKSAPSGNEEEKARKEKAVSEVRDGTKLQPPPFAERKNGEYLSQWCQERESEWAQTG